MNEIKNIIKETLERVTEFRSDYQSNEQAVRTQLIEPILNALGWKTSNPNFVRPNAPNEERKIPDYSLQKNTKTTLIVEAKNLSIDLQNNKTIDQLANYCFKSGIDFGILTNGIKWLLFKTFEKNPNDRIIWQVDLEKDKIDYVARSLFSFAYEHIDTLDTLLKTSKTLDSNWKLLIESTDSVVTIIQQKLLEKIKSSEPTFKIDSNDIKTFTKGKLEELFELNEIEEQEKDEDKVPDEKDTKSPDVEALIFKRKPKIREKISVKFQDEPIIKHNKVSDTFVDTIKRIGPEKILDLNIIIAGLPLISETKPNVYQWRPIGKYWIMVTTSTPTKLSILNDINKKLNLNLTIETFINER